MQQRLTTTGRESDPAWSPDGQRIAFVSGRDNKQSDIYVINADGSERVQVRSLPNEVRELVWFRIKPGK